MENWLFNFKKSSRLRIYWIFCTQHIFCTTTQHILYMTYILNTTHITVYKYIITHYYLLHYLFLQGSKAYNKFRYHSCLNLYIRVYDNIQFYLCLRNQKGDIVYWFCLHVQLCEFCVCAIFQQLLTIFQWIFMERFKTERRCVCPFHVQVILDFNETLWEH